VAAVPDCCLHLLRQHFHTALRTSPSDYRRQFRAGAA